MAAFFSQQFTAQPGQAIYWTFGFTIQVRRAGIQVFSEESGGYRYRGYLATFVTIGTLGNQIFPEHSLGAVWSPTTALILPTPIFTGNLLFRCTKQVPGDITFQFFGDDALN